MRVQLVNPPTFLNPGAMTYNRPSPPLGLAYVAAALGAAGHRVSVVDAIALEPVRTVGGRRLPMAGLRPEEVVERIDPGARVVGVTSMFTFAWPLVRELVGLIKRRYPSKIVIGGGETMTGMPEHCLTTSPLDFIVMGEGEATVVELLDAIQQGAGDFSQIAGLAYREGDRVVRTPPRAPIPDVDSLPRPAWDLFDLRGYYEHRLVCGVDAGMTVPMQATRGCPHGCSFCSGPMMWQRKWRPRAPEKVADEIEDYVRTYGARNFPFHDLTAIVRKDWTVAFCNELLKRKLDITWQLPAGTRYEAVDEEVAGLLKQTGMRNLAYAPETGSARMTELMHKPMSEEGLMKAVKATVRSGLTSTVFVLLGYPGETWADVRQSLRLVRKLAAAGVHELGPGYFFPVPGSTAFHQLCDEGKITLDDDFLSTPIFATSLGLSQRNNYSGSLSARQLTLAKLLLIANFYATSFALRPWRFAVLLWNVLHGKETTRLEGFFVNLRQHALSGVKGRMRGQAQAPEVHEGEPQRHHPVV